MQTTSHLLLIRPVNFAYNKQTAVNNAFQTPGQEAGAQENALKEFDDFVRVLQREGMDVTVVNDTPEPHTPDSIFPNNWISFHADGTVCLYPMYAPNRRLERKPAILEALSQKFVINRILDFSEHEKDNLFLEGTGSMVLDRDNRIAYAGLSPRTDRKILLEFCNSMNFTPWTFDASDERGMPVYHTNVLMCIAEEYAVLCLDAIPDKQQKQDLINAIKKTGKEIIVISIDQMNHFTGNMLQVNDEANNKVLIMSARAFQSLTRNQINTLESYNRIIHSSLSSIETNGGGSARCMIAEVHLPLLK